MTVPEQADRDTWINQISDDKKFQIKTDKKINTSHDIRWTLNGVGWFTFTKAGMSASKCNDGYIFKGTEGFLQRAGTITFLKSATQLQVWFDDVLEVTWVYEDEEDRSCAMRNKMTGLKFKSILSKYDQVSTHYRYQLGK